MDGAIARARLLVIGDRLHEERRKFGAFYTPEPLSQILSDWAIRVPADTILEPSFGGCGFLQSAKRRLVSLGCEEAHKHIYGSDVDPVAFDYLAEVFKGPLDLGRYRQSDFLDVTPGGAWPETFSVVLGNPPYIPYQALGTERRRALGCTEWPISGLGGRSSLWAYFIAHSITFLAEGGCMAWVLPGAFLQADYGKPIRRFLASAFLRVAAIVLRDRIFLEAGTDEETVVLLAAGFRSGASSGQIDIGQVETLEDLSKLIALWDDGRWSGTTFEGRPAALNLSAQDQQLIAEISASSRCKAFGELASVQIGLVTGANDFFVLSNEDIKKAGLKPEDCKPILAKFAAAPGIVLTLKDHSQFLAKGGRGLLVHSKREVPNKRVRAYFATFSEERIFKTSTFRKRKVWSKPDDGRVPDAFFPVMHHWGPRLVLNPEGLTSTNTIHRVYFREMLDNSNRQLIAVSLLTSFSQLSAELVGRHYGSGVLKHEPREAERVSLLVPSVSAQMIAKAFAAVNGDLRAGDRTRAMKRADEFVYVAAGINEWEKVSIRLTAAVDNIRRQRRPKQGQDIER